MKKNIINDLEKDNENFKLKDFNFKKKRLDGFGISKGAKPFEEEKEKHEVFFS